MKVVIVYHNQTMIDYFQWLGLKFPEAAVYLDIVRECYEAYVLYNFLCYLLNFLEFEYELTTAMGTAQPCPLKREKHQNSHNREN